MFSQITNSISNLLTSVVAELGYDVEEAEEVNSIDDYVHAIEESSHDPQLMVCCAPIGMDRDIVIRSVANQSGHKCRVYTGGEDLNPHACPDCGVGNERYHWLLEKVS